MAGILDRTITLGLAWPQQYNVSPTCFCPVLMCISLNVYIQMHMLEVVNAACPSNYFFPVVNTNRSKQQSEFHENHCLDRWKRPQLARGFSRSFNLKATQAASRQLCSTFCPGNTLEPRRVCRDFMGKWGMEDCRVTESFNKRLRWHTQNRISCTAQEKSFSHYTRHSHCKDFFLGN